MVPLAVAQNDACLIETLEAQSRILAGLATRSEGLCLEAGRLLGDAIPGLGELSGQFRALAGLVDNEELKQSALELAEVANAVRSIGHSLSGERQALTALIESNHDLSRKISHLSDDVRFLAAMISNVKIELASITEEEERLRGFALGLEQLVTKAKDTLHQFRARHVGLFDQLRQTALAQGSFESSHQGKLIEAAGAILSSLETVSQRQVAIGRVSSRIAAGTDRIGTQISQCVMALQIGDNTRQRLEHIGETLVLACKVLTGEADDLVIDRLEPDAPLTAALRALSLAQVQIESTSGEFQVETDTIQQALPRIVDAVDDLLGGSQELVAGRGGSNQTFLDCLESSLQVAQRLIDDSKASRAEVDRTADSVVSTIVALEALAIDVAAMAMDMTIIGTNAIVTSYRLGPRGLGLGIIAQHLRSHALRVSDGVKALQPALAAVLEQATRFASARRGNDAASMEGLSVRTLAALAVFRGKEKLLHDARQRLDVEAGSVAALLRAATACLDDAEPVKSSLLQTIEEMAAIAATAQPDDRAIDAEIDAWLDRHLRPRYTMAVERGVHDRFFGHAQASCTPPRAVAAISACA